VDGKEERGGEEEVKGWKEMEGRSDEEDEQGDRGLSTGWVACMVGRVG
jgi:hypothetical protein